MDIDGYRRMRERNADFHEGLARTNLAIRCWERRIGTVPSDVETLRGQHRRVLAWFLANHLVQGYYRTAGIDVRPFSISDMYGYGFAVGPREPFCHRRDVTESAWVACGSIRVDPHNPQGSESKNDSFQVAVPIAGGRDPLWVIDEGVVSALRGRWVSKCTADGCVHKRDAVVYRSVYQTITLLLAMGVVEDAILGAWVDCSSMGVVETPTHPLRVMGLVLKPALADDWFHIEVKKHEVSTSAWIHRSSGDLVTARQRRVVPYSVWCGGSVDRAVETLMRELA